MPSGMAILAMDAWAGPALPGESAQRVSVLAKDLPRTWQITGHGSMAIIFYPGHLEKALASSVQVLD